MTTHTRVAVSLWTLALVVTAAVFYTPLSAQGKSVNDGVYSDAQAKRGATLYGEQCASCHGETMEGVADLFPALTGAPFVKTWTGKSVGELFDKIQTTMPALDPGSLKPAQAADIVAFILSHSKYPAGAAELASTADALKPIQIVAPK
ncbi:MAG: cytochrome c [Acidobacteria bacterium]|nr:cytochrome c [Acidobacteriota bacterium]